MTRTAYKWLLFVRTAIRGIASSPVTSGVSVVTIGVTLVLVGAFALLLRNMEELLDQFGDVEDGQAKDDQVGVADGIGRSLESLVHVHRAY